MSWRDGAYDAQDVTDSSLNSMTLDSVAVMAKGDVLGFATPSQFIDRFGTWHRGTWGMIVTDTEVVVGKKGVFGTKIASTGASGCRGPSRRARSARS